MLSFVSLSNAAGTPNMRLRFIPVFILAFVLLLTYAVPTRAQDPSSVDNLYVNMGIYYRLRGVKSASEDHFENAWDKTGGDPEVALVAAIANYVSVDYGAALGWLKRIPSDSEQYALALCLEGVVYLEQAGIPYAGRSILQSEYLYSAAEQRFIRALELNSDLVFAKHMLARIYAVRGELQKAVALLKGIPEAYQIDAVAQLLRLLQQPQSNSVQVPE